jgi:hypothetical protein
MNDSKPEHGVKSGWWLLFSAVILFVGCAQNRTASHQYIFWEQGIGVDGDLSEWQNARWHNVSKAENQWLGQGITREGWHGPKDLSYSWAGAWDGKETLYFAFKVNDDIVIDPPAQPNSFLNDCIEIMIDLQNNKGPRCTELNGKKELRGYEMHFLPMNKPLVFVDDTLSPMYPLKNPQNDLFRSAYAGEIAVKKQDSGYVAEIGLKIPGIPLGDGTILGIDTDVCDDDGKGRESLLIWHSGQVDFWITMDHYGKVILRKGGHNDKL